MRVILNLVRSQFIGKNKRACLQETHPSSTTILGIRRRFSESLLCLTLLFSSMLGVCEERSPSASQPPIVLAMQQQLNAEQTHYDVLTKKFQSLKEKTDALQDNSNSLVTPFILEQANSALQMSRTEYENIQLNLQTVQVSIDLNQQLVQDLQKQSDAHALGLSHDDASLPSKLQEKRELLKLLQKRVQILQSSQNIAQKIVSTTQTWYRKLRTQHRVTADEKMQEKVNSLVSRLQKNQSIWVQQLQSQEAMLASNSPKSDPSSIFNLILTETENNQLQITVNLEIIDQKLQDLIGTLNEEPPISILHNLQKPFEIICTQLQEIENLLKKKRDTLEQDIWEQTQNPRVLHALNQSIDLYNNLLKYNHELSGKANLHFAKLNQQLRAHLSDRKDLPGFNLKKWINLAYKTSEIPMGINKRLMQSYRVTSSTIKMITWWKIIAITSILLGCVTALIRLKRLSQHPYIQAFLSSTVGNFLIRAWNIATLLLNKKYLITLSTALSISSVLLLIGVPFKAFSWILSLVIVATGFHIILRLIEWVLIEYTVEQTEKKTALYYQLKRALLLGGWITSANLLVHQIDLYYEVQHLFSRIFMATLLVIASILMKNWQLTPQLLENYLEKKPNYLKQVTRWVSFLLPFSLLSNAILGLIGYVQLAWAIAIYQGLFLLSTSLYFLIKGLLDNIIRQLSAQSIRRFRNGWLWSEALLKPLHQILKLTILIWLTVFFFNLAGWREEVFTYNITPSTLLAKGVWKISEVTITIKTLVEIGVIIAIIVWLSRWMREVAYRCFFATLKDLGLRNSLSTLIQYGSIALIIMVSCYYVGLSLTAVRIMFTGFSFGLALGIRDVFNNFVTGILLLLERPMKVGDWVTVNTYDGQVTHIGARSFIVNTEDHQELIVPNADIFSKHFINWTRHDSIVRVTLPILVNRGDNPVRVREIILEVLANTPRILNSPNPEVYFKDTYQMLLEFKIEYYVDMNQISSRAEVRSQFLFALWTRFREENILAPEISHSLVLQPASKKGKNLFSTATKVLNSE